MVPICRDTGSVIAFGGRADIGRTGEGRVEDEAGLRFWIYRDGLYGSELVNEEGKPAPSNWFVHGLFV